MEMYDVLRRLLNVKTCKKENSNQKQNETGRAWFGKGVSLPHGTLLKAEYNGRVHEGKIINGRWFIDGDYRSPTPSGAIGAVARTKAGKKTSLDGWEYWYVKRPDDISWIKADNLRN